MKYQLLIGIAAVIAVFACLVGKREVKSVTGRGEKPHTDHRTVENPAVPLVNGSLSQKRESAAAPKDLSHPRAQYSNPERIRSFFEPQLHQAYEMYFSLIGPSREKYSIAKAGFDSEANAILARATVENAAYRGDATTMLREGRAVLFAMAHLAKAQSDRAHRERERAIQYLKRRADSTSDAQEKALILGDLSTFYDLMGQEWDGSTL